MDNNTQQAKNRPIPPEEMTIETATQELRAIADALSIDLPNDAGYSEKLGTVAEFLAQLGEILQEELGSIRTMLNKE